MRTGKYGRGAVAEDSIMAVTNQCRAIIQDRADQCCIPMPEDNPFIEGYLMAETAVIAGQRIGSVVDNVAASAPVKEEVVSGEEFESVLSPGQFDDFATEEVPSEMAMNYENDEDNDDEWAPDPLESISPKRKSPRSKAKSKLKQKRKIHDRCGHSTVKCPICQNFKCKIDEGEQLCEHLEFCTEKFEYQDGDGQLSCPVCKKFTIGIRHKVEFAEHMSRCDEISQSSETGLKDHESSLLRWKIFSCDTCGEKGTTKFMKIDQFVDHLTHHMRCPFKCTRCSQRFKVGNSQYNFYHYKVNHPKFLQPVSSRCVFDGDLPTFFWWCPVPKCTQKFVTHSLRDEHIQFEHPDSCQDVQNRKSVTCKMCSSVFFCEDELRLHNATDHVFAEQKQGRVGKSVQNRVQQSTKHKDILTSQKRRPLPRSQKIIKRKVSPSSGSDNSSMSEEDKPMPIASRQIHKLTNPEKGYSRKEFQEILKVKRGEKERKSHSQYTIFCPHCNKLPCKAHQLAQALDHIETCTAAADQDNNSYDGKNCPVCLVKKFQMETTPVEYVEHVASCNMKDVNDGDGSCLIPLGNRLFKCTTCGEDEKKWMQVDEFLEHYIYHLRYRYKCTCCSHRFVSNTSKDNNYHYKAFHPDKLADPSYTRCNLEPELPELCWWCPVCSEKFSHDDERNVHFCQHHPAEFNSLQANKVNFICQWCSKTYYCADELKYHQGTRHVYDERERTVRNAQKPGHVQSEPPGRKIMRSKTITTMHQRSAAKKELVRLRLPSQKSQVNKPTKPRLSYVEACYFRPQSYVKPTMSNTKPVVALSSSSDFLTKLEFRQFLRKHFGQLYETEIPQQSNQRSFLCNICPDREAMDLAAFLDHYLFHKRKKFRCTKCSHRFPSNLAQDTKYHYKMIHPEHLNDSGIIRCVEDAVLPELTWVCFYCKEEFSSENLRDNHVEMEHPDKLSEEKSQLCQLCSKKYSCPEELLIHIATTHVLVEKLHKKDRRYKCNECLETFENWGDYRKHCRKAHNKLNKVGDDVKHDDDEEDSDSAQAVRVICDACGAEVKHTYLKRHLRLHCQTKTKKFHCEVPGCGESFTTNEHLGLHKFRKHESRDPANNPLVCPYCPAGEKVLHSRYFLRLHIQAMHHKKFNLQCDICGRGFLVKSQLLRHLTKFHQIGTLGQRKCTIEGCGKIFYRKELLDDHLSKHKGEPKYKCQFCGKEFYFKKGWQRHELIHKNAESKPHQCEICAKRFPVRNYLYIHMKSHKRKGEVQ